jgi:hypothetical protein
LRALLKRAVEKEKFTQASGLAGVLANLLRCTGRTSEALTIIESKTDYTRRAGLVPWTRLADEAWRLQLLNVLGKYDEVMRRVTELRDEMKILPDPPGSNETVYVWNVREATLDTGHSAAISLEQWQQALDLNAELLQSKRMRGATPLEQAKFRFNDYAPLLRLGRHADAGSILTECRAVFERENAIDALGRVFSALGNLENNLAHRAEARRFEETALRFKYIAGDPRDIGVSHFNLANYITRDKGAWRDALAHRRAAVLISVLTGEGKVGARISALVHNLRDTRRAGGPAMLPANFAMLCATVEQVEGVRFRELVERLAAGQTNGDDLLKNVVAMAAEAMEQTTKGSAQNSDQET